MDWTVQVKSGENEWCDPIDSDGPEIFAITGELHKKVKVLEVEFDDGSRVLYKRTNVD